MMVQITVCCVAHAASWLKVLASCCRKENGTTNLVCLNLCFWFKALYSFSSNLGLTFTNMVLAEQKLPVQIAGLYCIHVNLHSIYCGAQHMR